MSDVDDPVKPDRRRGRWAAHREQRRELLITAAIAAVHRYGPDVGMDAVAAEAGVSKPILYRYFADKSELWLAIAERIAGRIVAAVEPATAQLRQDRSMIAAVIDTYLTALSAEPDLYRVLHQVNVPGTGQLVAAAAETIAGALARVIGDRLRDLGLDAGPAEPWAYGLVGCVQSVGDWWLRHHQPISQQALTDYLTTLLWNWSSGVSAAADRPGGLAALS
jgi:AcrR family transcriptional regulator